MDLALIVFLTLIPTFFLVSAVQEYSELFSKIGDNLPKISKVSAPLVKRVDTVGQAA